MGYVLPVTASRRRREINPNPNTPTHISESRNGACSVQPSPIQNQECSVTVAQLTKPNTTQTCSSRDCLTGLPPPMFQKIRQIKPIIQLRPPNIETMRPNRKVDRLLISGTLQLAEFFPRNQQTPPITQAQQQEFKPRLRPVDCFHNARKAVELPGGLKGRINVRVCRVTNPCSHVATLQNAIGLPLSVLVIPQTQHFKGLTERKRHPAS